MTAAPPRRVVVVEGRQAGKTARMMATVMASATLRAGDVITTTGGSYRVAEVADGSAPPRNRHQRRAALAKWRNRHAG